jgi:hypothetical protein
MIPDNIEPEWVTTLPSKPGVYRWKRSWNWEDVAREVFYSESYGCLVTHAERVGHALPLIQIQGVWYLPDLERNAPKPAPAQLVEAGVWKGL